MDRNKTGSFFAGLSAGVSAVTWSVLHPMTGLQTLVIFAAVAAVQFLPWERWLRGRILLIMIGTGMSVGGGIDLLDVSFDSISRYTFWTAWIIFTVLLCYIGEKPLYKCGVVLGLMSLAFVLFSFFGVLVNDGNIEWMGGSWRHVAGGILTLTGLSLTGRELACDKCAARRGILCGLVIWGVAAFLPLILWSREALEVIKLPLLSSWQRLGWLSPNVLLTSLCALLSLWQSSGGFLLIYKYIKSNFFTKRI